jgi:hypothetical protein
MEEANTALDKFRSGELKATAVLMISDDEARKPKHQIDTFQPSM